ncbi:Sec-independent protein translocase protein TatB [Sphingomonas sp.]|uniref:Sec-independent protein translocase protein TatB n=1 Tax=Sphingomonas sp. TaxID=28214 RepID=UPI001DE9AE67|nr:Sec-independent protein translocase protein TatB [Sphingomonas sp.]MBX9797066.1 Sec-independent protein translocase protein TatB [Sphingomonas sp.]
MFDIAPSELLLVAIVALVVIGPKDLPKVMRVVGYWTGKARGAMRQFRDGFDAMVREAELKELEAKWAAENERIMRQFPATEPAMLPLADSAVSDTPALVPQPALKGAPSDDEIAAAEGVPPVPPAPLP